MTMFANVVGARLRCPRTEPSSSPRRVMFVEQWTRRVLADVCRTIGRSAADAKLLRHHTNAVYAVEDVVVKIAPQTIGIDVLRNVVALVEWLTASAFPTVHLATGFRQPLEAHGH